MTDAPTDKQLAEAPDGTYIAYSDDDGAQVSIIGTPSQSDGDRLRLLADYWDVKDRRALAAQLGCTDAEVPDEILAANSEIQIDLRRMGRRLDALDQILDVSAPRWRRRRLRRNFRDLTS